MDQDKLVYGVAIVVTAIWAGSHVISWISDKYTVPTTVQAAMMAVISALFAKPVLCKALKRGGKDIGNCDDSNS